MGRRKRPDASAPPTPGLEDRQGFDFALDPNAAPPPPLPGLAAPPAARAAATPAAPHYHGHRERLRARFKEAGPAALADYELLELLLFRTIPRADTKGLAKALIARFGDLAAVLAAEPARLAEIPGAGAAVAQDLAAVQAVLERASLIVAKRRPVVSSWSQLLNYCTLALQHETREQFRVLFLDKKNQLMRDEVMGHGTVDQAPAYPREIMRRALELGAAGLILVHNHPSGDPSPSPADVAVTREIIAAASAIGVAVHDHVVIGRHGAASFKSLGLI